ncbi:hypothetical protein [Paenibacillus typhae]|uniref:hypothetical protein n=1 Tax=Paenibacillus typhae TaxID=1174501 RepID=UPI001C8DDE22|nr:hypothetical protein [Paenibacillus typhae]
MKKDDSGIAESSFFAKKSCTCLDSANWRTATTIPIEGHDKTYLSGKMPSNSPLNPAIENLVGKTPLHSAEIAFKPVNSPK